MNNWIKKGYAWPAGVVILLLSSVITMGSVILAARNDGGAQVIEDYYQKAVQWDSLNAVKAVNKAPDWVSVLTMSADSLRFMLNDSLGQAVVLTDVTVELDRPQFSATSRSLILEPALSDGWVAPIPVLERGLWDVNIQANSVRGPLLFEYRRELR